MTIADALAAFDDAGQFPEARKIAWLSTLDGLVHRELVLTHVHDAALDAFAGYEASVDRAAALLVPYPYDRDLYPAYLRAMADRENGETARYDRSAAVFNAAYAAYQSYVNRTAAPLPAATAFAF